MSEMQACAGIKLNTSDMKYVDFVITDAKETEKPEYFQSICGLQFDSKYFKKIVNKDVSPNAFITTVGTNSSSTLLDSPCGGTMFDGNRFTLVDHVLSYGTALKGTLTFSLTPTDATVTLLDADGESVKVTANVANVVIGRTYKYKVEKTGYTTAEGTVTITAKTKTVTVTLTEAV